MGPGARVRAMLSSRGVSVVQATTGWPSWRPQKTVPWLTEGLVLRRQGPGDWMLGGQITGVDCLMTS